MQELFTLAGTSGYGGPDFFRFGLRLVVANDLTDFGRRTPAYLKYVGVDHGTGTLAVVTYAQSRPPAALTSRNADPPRSGSKNGSTLIQVIN